MEGIAGIVYVLNFLVSVTGHDGVTETDLLPTEMELQSSAGCYLVGRSQIHDIWLEEQFKNPSLFTTVGVQCIPEMNMPALSIAPPKRTP